MALKSVTAKEQQKKKETLANVEEKKPSGEPQIFYYAIAAIVAVVFVTYANSFGNKFVFDDLDLIVDAIKEGRFSSLANLLSAYRPVRTITYAIDYHIWGDNPLGFHLTNILIHAGNSILVFLLIRRLTGTMMIALLSALLFAVHPIQTDSVTYISGRRDILFGFFYLTAFMSYLNYKSSQARLPLALLIILWSLSLLSKEMAVSLPAIIFLWNFCQVWGEQEGSFFGRSVRAARYVIAKEKWLYLVMTLMAIAFSLYAIFGEDASQRVGVKWVSYYGDSMYVTLLTSARAQAWYLKQLVFPTPIAQYYGAFDLSNSIMEWRVIGSLALVGSILVSGFALLKRNALMAFAILSYFAMLAPVSQIVPHHEFAADHYLYLPIMCFALFLALVTQQLSVRSDRIRKVAYVAIIVAVIALASLTVMRNRVWKDGVTLWEDNYKAVPTSSRAAFNLAREYEAWNQKQSEELFLRSIELNPALSIAYTKLVKIYLNRNRVSEAEELVKKGLATPNEKLIFYSGKNSNKFRSELLTNLAAVRNQQGRTSEAEQALKESLDFNPANSMSTMMLAAQYRSNDKERELSVLREGLAADPSSADILHLLASELIEERRYEEATTYLKSLAALRPTDFYAHFQLARSYRILKDCRQALESSQSALDVAVSVEDIKNARELAKVVAQECGAR